VKGRGLAKIITSLGIIVAIYLFFCSQTNVLAEDEPHLLINEVYYDTIGVDSEEEWIELYNPTDLPVNLSGYFLGSNNDDDFQIETEAIIPPNSFYIIATDRDGFYGLFELEPNLSGLSLSFANSGDYVTLFDSDNNLVDAVVWEGGAYEEIIPHPGVATGQSIERNGLGIDSDNCEEDFRVLDQPLPLAQYSPPVYSTKIAISEVMPWPSAGSAFEFIELFNADNTTIDLTGWQLDDASGSGSSPCLIPEDTKIEPGEYLAFYNFETKLSLSNDGDTVRLVNPNLEEVSTIAYPKSFKDQSFSLIKGKWLWSLSVTPNLANIKLVKTEEAADSDKNDEGETSSSKKTNNGDQSTKKEKNSKISILDSRSKENGTIVTVEGSVTVLPGTLSTQYFYIEDDSSGIQVYLSSKEFPELSLGDIIEVTGELSERAGERRIKINSLDYILILEKGYKKPEPIPLEISEINENNEGKLVKISGEIIETSGDTFVVKSLDSNHAIKVVIRETTEIDKPRMRTGDIVEVSGVVSQYKEEYRILPTEQEDVKIISPVDLPRAGPNIYIDLLIFTGFILLWKFFPKAKNKLIKLLKT